jgi:hypothetical protein
VSQTPLHSSLAGRSTDARTFSTLPEMVFISSIACWHNGQQLTYVYFEDEPGRRSVAQLLAIVECDEVTRTITVG